MRPKYSKQARLLSWICIVLLALGSTPGFASAPAQTAGGQEVASQAVMLGEPRTLDARGELLVKFQDGVSTAARNRSKRQAGGERRLKKIGAHGARDIELIKLKPGQSVSDAVARLKKDPNVLIAEPNYRFEALSQPNDPAFAEQWGLHNTGQTIKGRAGSAGADIAALEAWDIETGNSNSVTVAVIDSGIDLAHPDLAAKLWQNPGEIAGNGLDDDGNGYINDRVGYNFAGISQYWYNRVQPLSHFNYEFAQSVRGTGEPLTEISLALARQTNHPTLPPPDPAYLGDIGVSVRAKLDGPDLATGIITPEDVPTFVWPENPSTQPDRPVSPEVIEKTLNWVQASLDTTVTLEAEKTYYLVVKGENTEVAVDNQYWIADLYRAGVQDSFPDGMEHWKIGDDWLPWPDYDLAFRTNGNGSPRDDNGHGTHVAGIIGAATDNSIGVAGVAPGANIMTLKALDSGGAGYLDEIVAAIRYAADNGAHVINMSLGGPKSEFLQREAINYADSKGVTIVASAGNSGPGTILYPAAGENVISVGATDNRDDIAWFSSTNAYVDISAPGVDIYSTMPGYPVAMNADGYNRDYDYMSGTSMASPMVAGAAALLLSYRPALKPIEVATVLTHGAEDLGAPGRDDRFGHGRLNVRRSLDKFTLSTAIAADSGEPDGDNDWYTKAPWLTVMPSLANADSFYAWNAPAPLSPYTGPIQAPEGINTLYYYSRTAALTEPIRSSQFKVDTGLPTDPTVTSTSHTLEKPSGKRVIDISLSGAADAVSGLAGYAVSWTNAEEAIEPAVNVGPAETAFSSPALADGTWWLNLRTGDKAGNWTPTINLGPFVIDGTAPAGGLVINSGAQYTNSRSVSLSLSASKEAGSPVAEMRFRNDGGAWSAWQTYATAANWTLAAGQGTKKVFAEFRDKAGNTTTFSDTIILDSVAPQGAAVSSPKLSTNVTKGLKWRVSWSASDPWPGAGVASYQVQVRVDGGKWKTWRDWDTATRRQFKGKPGNTYRFRVRAKDNVGNIGAWSKVRRTVVPYDDNSLIARRAGFNGTLEKASSGFYRGTTRYSTTAGEKITYKFTGKSLDLVGTKAKNRSKAKIYINGKHVATVDARAKKTRHRQVLFSRTWEKGGTRTITIENLGTPGRSLFDIDGLGVGR
jgi:subtilisin family serine protease